MDVPTGKKTALFGGYFMKTALQTVCFFLLFFFLFLICPSSCTSTAAIDRGAYTRQNFDARICGELDGIEFEGVLQNRPHAEGEALKTVFRVESPDSLRGITVSVDKTGAVSARLGEICKSGSSISSMAYFFLPVTEMGEAYSIEKGSNGVINIRVLDDDRDLMYIFASDSRLPSRINGIFRGKVIDLSVVEMIEQSTEKK